MRRCRLLGIGVGVALGIVASAPADAESTTTYDAIQIGVSVGGGTRDGLSITDVRPVSRGEAVAIADLTLALNNVWSVTAAGRLGASWFDFEQELATSGNMKDQCWSGGLAINRCLLRSGKVAIWAGLATEYGEARSWTDTRLFSDVGPRVKWFGGGPTAGATCELWRDLKAYGEVSSVLFKAHATDVSARSDYNWIGHLSRASIGLRIGIGGQRGSTAAAFH